MKKDIFLKIREILLDEWDPLLIGGNSHLYDEYDEFIEPIYVELNNNIEREQLSALLYNFASKLGVGCEYNDKVADAILIHIKPMLS